MRQQMFLYGVGYIECDVISKDLLSSALLYIATSYKSIHAYRVIRRMKDIKRPMHNFQTKKKKKDNK